MYTVLTISTLVSNYTEMLPDEEGRIAIRSLCSGSCLWFLDTKCIFSFGRMT